MYRLFQFLYRFRVFILFLALEAISFWLIVEQNTYQGAKYFNSSNAVTASVLNSSDDVKQYFNLVQDNEDLALENALLRKLLYQPEDSIDIPGDTAVTFTTPVEFITAKVINNSLFFQNNYITLNKGRSSGVMPGMGVIGPFGVVGQVQSASEQFSAVTSLLHTRMLVSSIHVASGSLCTTNWDASDPRRTKISYLPRHLEISIGDTVRTSGFNTVFPPATMIGTVENVNIADDATFYDITVLLATDFYRLSHVYLVKNESREEKDSLEIISKQLIE